jgi:transcriptional regulator with PAS, ATPase and Fis domain
MRFALEQVMEAATFDAAVLITGETGTGKDMVAAIHGREQSKVVAILSISRHTLYDKLKNCCVL